MSAPLPQNVSRLRKGHRAPCERCPAKHVVKFCRGESAYLCDRHHNRRPKCEYCTYLRDEKPINLDIKQMRQNRRSYFQREADKEAVRQRALQRDISKEESYALEQQRLLKRGPTIREKKSQPPQYGIRPSEHERPEALASGAAASAARPWIRVTHDDYNDADTTDDDGSPIFWGTAAATDDEETVVEGSGKEESDGDLSPFLFGAAAAERSTHDSDPGSVIDLVDDSDDDLPRPIARHPHAASWASASVIGNYDSGGDDDDDDDDDALTARISNKKRRLSALSTDEEEEENEEEEEWEEEEEEKEEEEEEELGGDIHLQRHIDEAVKVYNELYGQTPRGRNEKRIAVRKLRLAKSNLNARQYVFDDDAEEILPVSAAVQRQADKWKANLQGLIDRITSAP